ncbi:MAG: efflux RND transporter periplasmic adaptor subunit [Planctomycetales bacterium]
MSTTTPQSIAEQSPSGRPGGESIYGGEGTESSSKSRGKTIVKVLLTIGAIGLLFVGIATIVNDLGGADSTFVLYTVQRGDLPIVVTESGDLESQKKTKIICEVESVSFERSSSNGTQILSIVPDGTFVKADELLVELDSAPLEERVDTQTLATEKASLEQVQASVKYDNQITQNETLLEEAKLQVELANLALKQFEDESGGTFQLSLQDTELAIQQAQAERLIAATDLRGFEELYKLGYKSKGDLAGAQLKSLGADRKLAREISDRKMKVEYEYIKTNLELKGASATAKRSLIQVERDNKAQLQQALAARDAATRSLKKEQERLKKYTAQLDKCKIYAPHNGMVTYAMENRWSTTSNISEGAIVRQRQELINLPDLSLMQVKTSVHETVQDQITPGMDVTVKVEAAGNKTFRGTVKSVGVLPERGNYFNSDIKVYTTIVTIDEEVDLLKPGMTAVADIHVDLLKDVLTVPVQAIVQIGDESWCYVSAGSNVERRPVEVGQSNDKFVEIKSGLTAGEQIVLNTGAIMDESSDSASKASEEGDEEVPGSGESASAKVGST